MSNQVFPTLSGFDIKVAREQLYATAVQVAASGKELRASWWSTPRYRWQLTLNFARQAGFSINTASDEAAALTTFFQTHRGRWDSFLFTDPFESSVTAKNIGTGNGSNKVFPLLDGAGLAVTAINGAPSIYVNGVLKTVTTDYTITAGVVTFVTAPPSSQVVTWTGSYYRRVRFDMDSLNFERLADKAWDGKEISLISVK